MIIEHEPPTESEFILLRRVAVKFLDELKREDPFLLPYEDGAERYFEGDLRKFWDELAAKYPEITLTRVYTSVSPQRIQQLVAAAQRVDDKYEPPEFLTFFAIDTPSLETAEVVAKEFAQLKRFVEYAYVQPLASLPAITNSQKYVDQEISYTSSSPAIGGVDAMFAWSFASGASWGAGNGIRFVDIEKGWDLLHPLLRTSPTTSKISFLPGVANNVNLLQDPSDPQGLFAKGKHGTNTLGILAANPDSGGWKGIAESAGAHVVSIVWSTGPGTVVENIENSIMAAVDRLGFGDVILLELETQVQGYGQPMWPVECSANVFPPIRLATALGITVVEAAGNSTRDLDDLNTSPFCKNPNDPANPPNMFVPNPNYDKDSGAILVGAAVAVSQGGTIRGNRSSSSNFGSRVNCFAWGDFAHTADIDVSTGANTTAAGAGRTTTNYSGTSCAAAIIAGTAVVLQSIAKHELGVPFNALRVRQLLGNLETGTLTANSTSTNLNADRIGVMPNLSEIVTQALNLTADIVIRDNLLDDGRPHVNAVFSPDIIVRPSSGTDSVSNPQAAFGGTATMNNANLSTAIYPGAHDIFVRVFNRGRGDASNARAAVYFSSATTLVTPNLWTRIGSSTNSTSVPRQTPSSMTVLSPVDWPANALPGPGHYCFVATVGCAEDPDPIPDHTALTRTLTFDEFLHLVRSNNNISWRNFNVLPMNTLQMGRPVALHFLAPGAFDIDRPMQLEVVAQLPAGAELSLVGSARFVNALQKGYFEDMPDETLRLPLRTYGETPFREILFPANSENPLQLLVELPAKKRQSSHDRYVVYVRHLYQNEEIGRVTWQFVSNIEADGTSVADAIRQLLVRFTPLTCLLALLVALGILMLIYMIVRIVF